MTLDPWGNALVDDYERLCKDFGIEKIETVMDEALKKNRFFRRGIIFGHRDLGVILKAIKMKKPWAVMSGIKPSGAFHLGTFTTASEIVEFQKMGGKAYYAIADIESWQDNGISYEMTAKTAIDNLADILAVGLDPKNAYIWRQSAQETVKDLPYLVSRGLTNNMLDAIYGERQFGLYLSALVQVGDILLPQLQEGPVPTVVPVGIDQDPHIRLTRDLTRKYFQGVQGKQDFFLPGSTYHKLLPGLDGTEKMSKRNPNSSFGFDEDPASIKRKLQNALTGGRDTKEEQQRLGGQPEKCMIHKLLQYHFLEDDKKLQEIWNDCKSGKLLCGPCKKYAIDMVLTYVKSHQEKKVKLIPVAKKILGLEDVA
ncbi:MAG: tryptophan--tRNA ligase [Candidatus Sigynarchaeota archaeon]